MYICVYIHIHTYIYIYIYMYFIISPSWTNCNLNCSHLKNSLPAIIVKYWPHGPSPPFRPSLGNTFALEGFVWNICIYRYITSKNTISSSIVLITLSIFTFIYCRYTQKNKTTLEPGTYVEHFDLYNPGNTFLSFGLGMYISVYLYYINST